jgi:hypothetical protein
MLLVVHEWAFFIKGTSAISQRTPFKFEFDIKDQVQLFIEFN